MKPIKQTDTDPMEQAYKELDGSPAGDAVSKAAKGEHPQTDFEAQEDHHDEMVQRMEGVTSDDLENAYSKLFEALAVITRH